MISLKEAGRRIKANPAYLKGVCEGKGIDLLDAPPSLLLTPADFDRLRQHVESRRPVRVQVSA